jgi:hypothetical protein
MKSYVSNPRQGLDGVFQAILWCIALTLWAYNISAVTTVYRQPIDNLVWYDGKYRNDCDDCIWHECAYQGKYWIEDCEGNKYELDDTVKRAQKYVVYVRRAITADKTKARH